MCNGQLLPINQNQAIFSLLGTTYGGDGRSKFALPNLQGRTAMHMGQSFTLGQRAGEEQHTLIMSEMAAHIHPAKADVEIGQRDVRQPGNNAAWRTRGGDDVLLGSSNMVPMYPQMVTASAAASRTRTASPISR